MSLDALIRAAVERGSQVHIWPEHFGAGYTGVVRGQHGCRHTSRVGPDAVATLTAALVEDDRLARDAAKAGQGDGRQFEIEGAIAAADDEFGDFGL